MIDLTIRWLKDSQKQGSQQLRRGNCVQLGLCSGETTLGAHTSRGNISQNAKKATPTLVRISLLNAGSGLNNGVSFGSIGSSATSSGTAQQRWAQRREGATQAAAIREVTHAEAAVTQAAARGVAGAKSIGDGGGGCQQGLHQTAPTEKRETAARGVVAKFFCS